MCERRKKDKIDYIVLFYIRFYKFSEIESLECWLVIIHFVVFGCILFHAVNAFQQLWFIFFVLFGIGIDFIFVLLFLCRPIRFILSMFKFDNNQIILNKQQKYLYFFDVAVQILNCDEQLFFFAWSRCRSTCWKHMLSRLLYFFSLLFDSFV